MTTFHCKQAESFASPPLTPTHALCLWGGGGSSSRPLSFEASPGLATADADAAAPSRGLNMTSSRFWQAVHQPVSLQTSSGFFVFGLLGDLAACFGTQSLSQCLQRGREEGSKAPSLRQESQHLQCIGLLWLHGNAQATQLKMPV